ncbi:MAG: YggS family pyridoxal phosphate-dependent enzyme [Alicyclobacillaceae bacterium]|nr:YggS family pyridoxal phosphate-dependent enzyme [Alicyclobacillaceae bacterium]
MAIEDRWREVRSRIARACARAGRDPDTVKVVAVTKYIDPAAAGAWAAAGLRDFGENRWTAARSKIEALGPGVTWHFIGHLQTNKVKYIVRFFHWLHSLDRPALAEELARRLGDGEEARSAPLYTLIQVNVAEEPSKGGISVAEAGDFLDYVHALRRSPLWKVVGWMTMAPRAESAEEVRWVFRTLRELRDRWRDHPVWAADRPLELSMGMSDDYEVAVEEGATIVRLGRVLLDGGEARVRDGPQTEREERV